MMRTLPAIGWRARAIRCTRLRPCSSLSSWMQTRRSRKYSLRSSVQLLAPSLLVVATKFILASASASFSPSVMCIFVVSGAACSSGKRYGIFGPSGLPATHIWPFHLFWKNPLAAVRQTCKYGVPFALRYMYLAMIGDHGLVPPLPFLFLPEEPLAFFFGSNSGSPSFFLTKSRHAIGSSPAKLCVTKPSGAKSSSLIASERSSALCPGPGTSASPPATSPPRTSAILLIEGRIGDIVQVPKLLRGPLPRSPVPAKCLEGYFIV